MVLAVVLLLMLLGATSARAQDAAAGEPVRVFLDCGFCDDDYLQVETPWVSFVRDRDVAGPEVQAAREARRRPRW